MKKFYTLICFAFTALFANAAIHPITVEAMSFSPASVNAVSGDTIVWIWGQSGTHTTTSTSVPSCAAAWNAPINSSSPTFSITVSCMGTYSYQCTFHASMGMVGNLIVASISGVPNIDNNYFSTSYPNPFAGKVSIEVTNADMITLYNMVGEKLKSVTLPHGQTKTEIDTADLEAGIYFYSIVKEGIVVETRKIVKN